MSTGIEAFRLDSLPAPVPFPSAVRAGDTIYLSGQIGHLPGEMRLVPGGLEPETRQALAYMAEALALAGVSKDRVAKCSVFLADMADFAAFNRIYEEFFGTHRPARSSFEAKALALGARVEIECIAVAG